MWCVEKIKNTGAGVRRCFNEAIPIVFYFQFHNKRKGGTGHYSCKIFMGCKLVQQVATHGISKQISE